MANNTLRTVLVTSILVYSLGVNAHGFNESVRITNSSSDSEYSNLNGRIEVDEGVHKPDTDISTVNGKIAIGNAAQIGHVKSVNGSIRLDENVVVAGIDSVNGRIRVGAGGQVAGDVATVNGGVSLAEGGSVGGDLTSVNGRIAVTQSRIRGDLSNYNGGIEVLDGSVVEGDVRVKKPRGRNYDDEGKRPKIIIGRNSQVLGRMVFERDVDLYVHNSAQVGAIDGATPQAFSGNRP